MAISLVTIDPGLAKTGWASWDRSGTLLRCGLSKAEGALNERIRQHRGIMPHHHDCRVVCERMQARYGNAKGDVQDLIDLNLLAGALGNEWITVREWKGSMPRNVEQVRTRRTLTQDELKLLPVLRGVNSVGHDVWSAVGIGLYVLGRYPG